MSRLAALAVAMALVVGGPAGPATAQLAGDVAPITRNEVGELADADSRGPSISADGRFTAFASDATNLVPLDTNGDTDVFVHDAETGLIERVSVTWQGQEARDDSDCPSISADGRYVAFNSKAWNMYPGGANLGWPKVQVYVRDRVNGTTTRVTVPYAGAEPDRDAWGCPAISGDGSLVAFLNLSSNLVEGAGVPYSTWPPAMYLRDLSVGVTRIASRTAGGGVVSGYALSLAANGGFVAFKSLSSGVVPPAQQPPDPSETYVVDLLTGVPTQLPRCEVEPPYTIDDDLPPWWNAPPAISGDGRFIAYGVRGTGTWDVCLFDREIGSVERVSVPRPIEDCGRPGRPLACLTLASDQPTISADGRFVAFVSYSRTLLSANAYTQTQVYLFDRLSKRLRRLSVGAGGIEPDHCGASQPALSGDGSVVAYKVRSDRLLSSEAERPVQDIVRTRWSCASDGGCRPLAECPASPATCEPPLSSHLQVRRNPPGGTSRDTFRWRWRQESGFGAFGNPSSGADYQLCLYAGDAPVTEHDLAIPGGEGWRETSSGYRLRDSGKPVHEVSLIASEGATVIDIKGRGPLLDLPYLPLAGELAVRLHDVSSGRCWGADFPTSTIQANVAGEVLDDDARVGLLRARLQGPSS